MSMREVLASSAPLISFTERFTLRTHPSRTFVADCRDPLALYSESSAGSGRKLPMARIYGADSKPARAACPH
ncbi:hypothetical protein F441_15475 [Phytophthora nicotianae CJ01A1]|uniref:Uncharacterized protein n=1 Tax=Phytophthora nicotianae CJ01A1 TaxID=1317063 RepID=W2WER7_PHYNI|nr:hypothetical protein F441_15475 [Phytophthora nicotianae CJ01A1]